MITYNFHEINHLIKQSKAKKSQRLTNFVIIMGISFLILVSFAITTIATAPAPQVGVEQTEQSIHSFSPSPVSNWRGVQVINFTSN